MSFRILFCSVSTSRFISTEASSCEDKYANVGHLGDNYVRNKSFA